MRKIAPRLRQNVNFENLLCHVTVKPLKTSSSVIVHYLEEGRSSCFTPLLILKNGLEQLESSLMTAEQLL